MVVFTSPTPMPVILGGFVIPYLIAYLVHIPNTRLIRLGLFPVGLLCAFWTISTIQLRIKLLTLPLAETLLKWNLNGGTQYAFWNTPPSYPPLPRLPPIGSLRDTRAIKALNLLIDANRLTSLKPVKHAHIPYWRAIASHLGRATVYVWCNELITFPNHSGWISPNDPSWGVHTWKGSVLWPAIMGLGMYTGTAMLMELFACMTILMGLYNGEEWGPFFDLPILSSSLNELWGRRYHHFMRGLYLRLARPFEYGPRALHIMAVFFLSGLYHLILYYPFTQSFEWSPHLRFWLGSGVGVLIERAFYKATGRRVGGWAGRCWLFGWFWLVSRPMVLFEMEHGWMKISPDMSREAKWEDHPINWVLYAVGLPGPLDWKRA